MPQSDCRSLRTDEGKIGGVQARATLEHTLMVEIADRTEAVKELRWVY